MYTRINKKSHLADKDILEKFRLWVNKKYEKEEISDGFDDAYFSGLNHIYKEAGDGGLSEQYFQGLQDGLKKLKSLYLKNNLNSRNSTG